MIIFCLQRHSTHGLGYWHDLVNTHPSNLNGMEFVLGLLQASRTQRGVTLPRHPSTLFTSTMPRNAPYTSGFCTISIYMYANSWFHIFHNSHLAHLPLAPSGPHLNFIGTNPQLFTQPSTTPHGPQQQQYKSR